MQNKIFNSIIFIISGIIGGVLLIFIGELTRFSHTNLVPFGGNSWAVWFYPIAIGFSFGISAKLFKISKFISTFIIVTLIALVIFYFLYNKTLFINPIPFGINAEPVL